MIRLIVLSLFAASLLIPQQMCMADDESSNSEDTYTEEAEADAWSGSSISDEPVYSEDEGASPDEEAVGDTNSKKENTKLAKKKTNKKK